MCFNYGSNFHKQKRQTDSCFENTDCQEFRHCQRINLENFLTMLAQNFIFLPSQVSTVCKAL